MYHSTTYRTGIVEPDGSILAGGVTQDGCSGSGGNFKIVRYPPAGGNASAFPDKPIFQNSWDEVRGLARQSVGIG